MRFKGKGNLIGGIGVALVAGLLSFVWVNFDLSSPPEFKHVPLSPEEEEETPNLPPLAYFHDMTPLSGVDFTCRNGEQAGHYTLLESLGGGAALFDFDGDGLLDLFLIGGGDFRGPDNRQIQGLPCKLYKNLGHWKFQDVTAQVGFAQPSFYSHGCAVADYDCDGWPDLLVTGYGGLALYHNESDGQGGRRLVEGARAAGLSDSQWNTSAAWADLDGDGYPDLYICRYVDWSWATHTTCPGDSKSVPLDVCPPKVFKGVPHALYSNVRNRTFTLVSQEAGLRQQGPNAGMGLGVVVVDVDGDGRPDIYAVNDTTENFLYHNRGSRSNFLFQDLRDSGAALGPWGHANGSMGVDAADYDGCGRPSLWVTTFEKERHALYHNECIGKQLSYVYATFTAGIAGLGSSYVGFGTGFVDVDNDGWEDIVISNGHVRRHPTRGPLRQKAVFLRNLGTKRFLNSTVQGGPYFQVPQRGRGLAIGDLDNDGRPDLVITHLNEPVVLLRNDPQGAGLPKHHWLGIELVGHQNRDIAGAKVVVEAGGRRLTRFAKGGGSYLSASDRRVLIGLAGAEKVERVTVHWPWGQEQHWTGLGIDRYWQLVEEKPARQ